MKEYLINDEYKFVYCNKLSRYVACRFGKRIILTQKLYKIFNNTDYNLEALSKGYVYLSNPSDFNDPFDCNINLLNFEDEKYNQTLTELVQGNLISSFGIACFTEEILNTLMWGHYTDNYEGFALEFDIDKSKFIDCEETAIGFQPVLYLRELVKIKKSSVIADNYLLIAKKDIWSYEKEWRMIVSVDEDRNDSRLQYYTQDSIKSIYVGYKLFLSSGKYKKLKHICDNKYPNIPIYIIKPDTFKMELVAVPLNDYKLQIRKLLPDHVQLPKHLSVDIE